MLKTCIITALSSIGLLASSSVWAADHFSTRAAAGSAKPSALRRVSSQELPTTDWEGTLADFRLALDRQIASCRALNLGETWNFAGRTVTRRDWCIRTAERFITLTAISTDFSDLMRQARTEFEWYRSIGDSTGDVKYTGYYFPSIDAAAAPDAEYTYPLYAKPSDLVKTTVDGKDAWRRRLPDGTLAPFFTRKEIDMGGALQGRNLEIAWVKDPLEAFIFQVQGAGALHLKQPDGTTARKVLNYAGKNGQAYVSLRRILSEQGVTEEFLTLQGMRRYFALHPEKLMPSLVRSPGYVFFEESNEGPYGVANLLLTAGHSIAIDAAIFPMGAVALVRTERPLGSGGQVTSWQDFSRLVLSQDTGGAIKTPGHVDFYWGDDEYAEFAAGQMNQSGSLFFAVLPAGK